MNFPPHHIHLAEWFFCCCCEVRPSTMSTMLSLSASYYSSSSSRLFCPFSSRLFCPFSSRLFFSRPRRIPLSRTRRNLSGSLRLIPLPLSNCIISSILTYIFSCITTNKYCFNIVGFNTVKFVSLFCFSCSVRPRKWCL